MANITSLAEISTLVVEPLRYFFSNYTDQYNLIYSDDEKERTIDIGYINDFAKTTRAVKPRILIDRGSVQVQKSGLSDNMSSQKTFGETGGLVDRQSLVFYAGSATVIITARNQGVCELITDLTSHFLIETRGYIAGTLGFKEFGMPMMISSPIVDGEDGDTESFTCTISLPYVREERWRSFTDGVKFKSLIRDLIPNENI